MKVVNLVITFLLAAVSVLAGAAKVLRMPQELEFLQAVGLNVGAIVVFGIAQLLGGVLLLFPKSRLVGAVLATVAFAISAMLILVSGNLMFGLVSMIPTALAAFVVYQMVRGNVAKQ